MVIVVYSSGYLFWIRSLARGGCASGERPPQVPAFMVAGSTGRPMPLIAGRKRVRFLNFLTISAMASADAARSTTAITLPLFPKERPLASEVSDLVDSAKSILPADQKALMTESLRVRSLSTNTLLFPLLWTALLQEKGRRRLVMRYVRTLTIPML